MTDKRCLIYETLGKVSNLQIKEAAGDGLMRLEGVFGVCGVKNQNNRVYDKNNYKQMVESLQKTIKESGCPGELEHPNSMNINLENVSHKIESIQMNEDGTITGTIVLLNTPKGQIAQAIVEGGLPLYISSRGAGTITNEGRVTLSTIKTYDLVGTPGFSQAKLTLKENQTLECLNESQDDGNIMYAIVEGDDDLLGGDDSSDEKDSEKKDDKKEEKKEDKKDDKKEEKKESDKKEEKSESDEDKEDNKNTEKEDTSMNDLKQAIDKLSEKVTSLEAELHVAKESLNEASVNYDAIEKWINEELVPTIKTDIVDSLDFESKEDVLKDYVDTKIHESIDAIGTGIETWAAEEFTPQMKNWVVEEFAPEVQNWVCEEFAPEVQNWVCEEFAPEVQGWITEEFAPEVQNWVTEEFAPEVQGWITEEFAPEVQNWITEEFAPVIDNWINEEFAPEQMNNISEFLNESKVTRLEEIDSLLESLSDNKNEDLTKIVNEQNTVNKYSGVYVVEHMPAEYRPSWELLSENKQQEIVRSSKMYDFTKDGVLESFWANVDFNEKKQVNEQKEDNTMSFHKNIINQMKYLRNSF